ncbi:MAG: N-acetylmuramoyl-L-alanine amidase, partial [Balneolaceae bacterium]|nr:N-acetylmuramoyl-L-alanine amidase [Balneolaceae bacterium]
TSWGGIVLLMFTSATLFGQENPLERVSAAERSDGRGYVIRFHLSEAGDSFKVTQPDVDLIQMTL